MDYLYAPPVDDLHRGVAFIAGERYSMAANQRIHMWQTMIARQNQKIQGRLYLEQAPNVQKVAIRE